MGDRNKEQLKALKNAFHDVDINGTGKIETSDLRAVLQIIGQIHSQHDIEECEKKCNSEYFTEEELCKFVEANVETKSSNEIEKELMEAFDKFDVRKDGKISREEFRKAMTYSAGGEPLTDEEVDTLLDNLKSIDRDGNFIIEDLSKFFMK